MKKNYFNEKKFLEIESIIDNGGNETHLDILEWYSTRAVRSFHTQLKNTIPILIPRWILQTIIIALIAFGIYGAQEILANSRGDIISLQIAISFLIIVGTILYFLVSFLDRSINNLKEYKREWRSRVESAKKRLEEHLEKYIEC